MARIVQFAVALVLAWSTVLASPQSPEFALANVYREGVDLSGYWVSEKLDGVRALWDGEGLYSRRGNRFAAPVWFTREFPAVALDGELWMGRGTFEVLSGVVRRQVPDEDAWRDIRFMVFDLPGHPGLFDERLRRLREIFAVIDLAQISLVEQFRVADHGELMEVLRRVVTEGGEGLMLRLANSRHRAGRSDDLLKVKLHEEGEAVVVAHLPGGGKYKGMLGSLLVQTPEGRRFKLGTGFSDAERRQPPKMGAIVTYRYFGKTARGVPRFASFVRVREEI